MTFTLTLQTRPGIPSNGPFRGALVSLWLLTHLGRIGSRARRGAGDIQVISVQGSISAGVPDLQARAQTPQQLCDELANGLRQLKTLTVRRQTI
jgi:CRISPR/Cas system CMR-associated protein Cmr1 (group 7 of RAMP superfamily)